jgi:hypothetical protein
MCTAEDWDESPLPESEAERKQWLPHTRKSPYQMRIVDTGPTDKWHMNTNQAPK